MSAYNERMRFHANALKIFPKDAETPGAENKRTA